MKKLFFSSLLSFICLCSLTPAFGQNCDTLTNLSPNDTLTLYTVSGGGYISGHNQYGDPAKADLFINLVNGGAVQEIFFSFGHATASSPNTTFEAKIWAADGVGGAPGTVLGSTTIKYSDAVIDVANNNPTSAFFGTHVFLPDTFYAGIEFTYSNGDTIALFTTADSIINTNTGWEKWDDGSWHSYDDATSWGLQISHAIFPVVCQCQNCINKISGYVYKDLNGNCIKDSSEAGLAGVGISISGLGKVYTNSSGYFERFVPDTGSFVVSPILPQYLTPDCPQGNYSYTITFSGAGNTSSDNNFSIDTVIVHDMKVAGFCGVARPGFIQYNSFTVSNNGTVPTSGTATVTLDSKVQFLPNLSTAGANYNAAANVVTWDYDTLSLHQAIQYNYAVQIPPPPTVNNGDSISHTIHVDPLSNDIDTRNNESACTIIVTGSYDPNDKAVTPVGFGEPGFIFQTDTLLYYKIRFQNTGTDTAFTVVIRDTLHPNLNWSSFEFGTASHPYEVEFEQDHILVFTFNNILLPDSHVNEPASNGHVTFFMKTNGVLPLGAEVTNRAAIYFDFNEPVITNTVRSTVAEPDAVQERLLQTGPLKVFPNPTDGAFSVVFESSTAGAAELNIINYTGSIVYRSNDLNLSKGINTIKIEESLPQGIYLLKISNGDESKMSRVIIVK